MFGEGTSTIDAEAIEGVLANIVQGEDASTVLREFAQDGGLGFLDPTDLDIDLEGTPFDVDLSGLSNLIPEEIREFGREAEDVVRAIGSETEDVVRGVVRPLGEAADYIKEQLPHGTTPDIRLPDGPDIDLPEGPDIDLPGINLGGGGGGGLSNYVGYMGGFNYELPESRMINYVPNQPTDAMQMSEGMLLGMAKNRGRV